MKFLIILNVYVDSVILAEIYIYNKMRLTFQGGERVPLACTLS